MEASKSVTSNSNAALRNVAGKFRQLSRVDQQPRVETVEEFKLRIAAIIRGKPEQITGAPRPDPRLVRGKKLASYRKAKRRTLANRDTRAQR